MRPRKFDSQFSVATSIENNIMSSYVTIADLYTVVSKMLLLKHKHPMGQLSTN